MSTYAFISAPLFYDGSTRGRDNDGAPELTDGDAYEPIVLSPMKRSVGTVITSTRRLASFQLLQQVRDQAGDEPA